jgi:hypothetical protein
MVQLTTVPPAWRDCLHVRNYVTVTGARNRSPWQGVCISEGRGLAHVRREHPRRPVVRIERSGMFFSKHVASSCGRQVYVLWNQEERLG